ncbi:uncharacterized protein ACR2FA_006231 isoform 1-T1 [Aphomia sociella]
MRTDTPRYPVDRYLVEGSKKIEMVNIIDDDIWNPVPALKPEDEIILRKLHEMLQTTADDLKIISNEISKHHEPGVQIKTLPTPLDEEFNEKVHIEEVVNAKFHGYKIVDKTSPLTQSLKNDKVDGIKLLTNTLQKPKTNVGVQANLVPILKKPYTRKLEKSHTKVIQIGEKSQIDYKENKLNNIKVPNNTSAVTYSEYSYIYAEPETTVVRQKKLEIQKMPEINIRSELKEQKVLQLDIVPDSIDEKNIVVSKINVAVIVTQHESESVPHQNPLINDEKDPTQLIRGPVKLPARKVSRMSTCDSSSSTNNISFHIQHKSKNQKQVKIRSSPKNASHIDSSKIHNSLFNKKQPEKRPQRNLEEWKRKLNTVYGSQSSKKVVELSKNKTKKMSSKKLSNTNERSQILNNNAEYIPYSQLTLGGIRVSDIERELSDAPNKNDTSLLDRILINRENTLQNHSPRKQKQEDNFNILTTSDENLLQEVIDIERTISDTLSKNLKNTQQDPTNVSTGKNEQSGDDSYADDFEDEKSEHTEYSEKTFNKTQLENDSSTSDSNQNLVNSNKGTDPPSSNTNSHNNTYVKTSNLSLKSKVDVFEFVHLVDTQDIATQSNAPHKISLKETQTSPRNESSNIQPIHNDLWPTIDPKWEVEKMLTLEKDFIKKLIIDEYGDILEKTITKPSTSKGKLEDTANNVVAIQKNTQTSPMRRKSVMTSPIKMKTRTTSPFTLSVPIDRQTSPIVCLTNEEELKLEIENEVEDLGISINLSSPRFSLRLPQNSRDLISNLEVCSQTLSKVDQKEDKQSKEPKTFRNFTISSTSSADADHSSSEISSLGEIKLKLKRKLKKTRLPSTSDTSTSSILSKCSSELQSYGILPLKSEGEVSVGQVIKNKCIKRSESDGETSIGRFN